MLLKRNTPQLIPNAIRSLIHKSFGKGKPLLSSLHHFCFETGVVKKRRSDNFFNIQKVLLVMIPEVELSTLSVGNFYMRHDGKLDFYNQGVDWIVEKSGLKKKTVSRVLSTLVKSGYMTVRHCVGKNTQGEEIRYNSIRTFTNKFFIECGARNETIEEAKHKKQKKLIKKFSDMSLSKKCQTGIGKVSEAFKKAVKNSAKKAKNKKGSYNPTYTSKTKSHHDEKNLIKRAYDKAVSENISPSMAYNMINTE